MEELPISDYCANPTCTVDSVLNIIKKKQVHEINKGRRYKSEYHYLFPVLQEHSDKFEKYMRIKITTFQYILAKLEEALTKNWCNLHKQPILPEEKLVITIRFLATGASYSDLSFAFLMGKSTISGLIEDVCSALWTKLQPLHMPVPTADRLMDVAQEFYLLWDIPHCVGAIDVKHVRIKKPSHSGSLYYNYKKFFSITLQAVADARYKFVSIDVGGYGHQHDATTFRYSTLYRDLKSTKVHLPEDDELYNSNTVLPYFFIGDGAYPLSRNLIKPYPGKNLSQNEKLLNSRLSRARVTIECAFGQLCQKFRIFYKTMEFSPEKAELIFKSACILHNVIKDCEKPATVLEEDEHQDVNDDDSDDNNDEDEVLIGNGEIVRKKLIEFFIENPI